MSSDAVFTLFYLLISFSVIYPPNEFISAGLTIPAIFGSFLGSEDEQFIQYNLKKSLLSVLVYSLLPVGYIAGLIIFVPEDYDSLLTLYERSFFWKVIITTSFVWPLLAIYYIKRCTDNNWDLHPAVCNLKKFCNNNNTWTDVATDINTEYRRVEKVVLETNSINKVVVTENWIIKLTPLTILVAHQSDATLEVNKTDTHHLSVQNSTEVQFINIEIKSSRSGANPFTVRINALDFRDFQDRVARTISILPGVKFHKNLIEQFVDAFKEAIKNNQAYVTNQVYEQCIGCLQNVPNVKIQKLCGDEPTNDACGTCYCRPMWCSDCLAKWFASRQDPSEPNKWLSSKCTCPMCRVKFCVLDVCIIDNNSE